MYSSFPKVFAEWLGTTLLLTVVIGSGIMADRLAQGNTAIALLGNTLATVWGLSFLISTLGPVSGAHFNPAVSSLMTLRGELPARLLFAYIGAQLLGGVCGAWLAHAMFELPLLQWSGKVRTGNAQWLSEIVATAGLILVILRAPSGKAATLVASYIGAAYWFTASTSFANPAAAFGRMFSNTFAGIAPGDVPAFILSQFLGAALGWGLHCILLSPLKQGASEPGTQNHDSPSGN